MLINAKILVFLMKRGHFFVGIIVIGLLFTMPLVSSFNLIDWIKEIFNIEKDVKYFPGESSNLLVPNGLNFIGTSDFNGDGKTDFLFINISKKNMIIWHMNYTSFISQSTIVDIRNKPKLLPAAVWIFVSVADFNKDSKPDLVWRNKKNGQIAIWYLNGSIMQSASIVNTS